MVFDTDHNKSKPPLGKPSCATPILPAYSMTRVVLRLGIEPSDRCRLFARHSVRCSLFEARVGRTIRSLFSTTGWTAGLTRRLCNFRPRLIIVTADLTAGVIIHSTVGTFGRYSCRCKEAL